MSERELLDLLWHRLGARLNGDARRYIMAEQVRHHPAFGNHIADALAVDTWGSGRYQLEGYEVKCTRSDWRRELPPGSWFDRASGEVHDDVPYVKSYPWRRHCTRWYILAPAGIIPRGELPDGWGLIEARSGRLRCTVQAQDRPDVVPLAAQQVAGLMRAVQQTTERHSR